MNEFEGENLAIFKAVLYYILVEYHLYIVQYCVAWLIVLANYSESLKESSYLTSLLSKM
jgi:hypothetical protein